MLRHGLKIEGLRSSLNSASRTYNLLEYFGESFMRLQFVGCGDAFGSGGRFNTCLHLTGRDANILIDCGASSLVAMNELAIPRNDIDAIFLSHFHADHVGGIPFFLLEANYVSKRKRPLTIAGPPSLKRPLRGIMEIGFAGTKELKFKFPLRLTEFDIGKSCEARA
jgi:ribonuclease BN (tRNA processing enzyme)